MGLVILLQLLFFSNDGWAGCPQFETALQQAAARFEARVLGSSKKIPKEPSALAPPELPPGSPPSAQAITDPRPRPGSGK